MAQGEFTRHEIASQPEIWRVTYDKTVERKAELNARLNAWKDRPFIVIGCGSTHYLAMHTAAVLRSRGLLAWARPSSELVYYPQSYLPADFVLLVISRSGTTTESLWAMQAYRKQNPDGAILSISCVPQTPMIAGSDIALVSEAAQEESVAQTRSFTSMALMVQILAASLSPDDQRLAQLQGMPAVLEKLFARYHDLMEITGRNTGFDRLFFLGSGPYYGLACEAMLKTKEMSSSWAEAYHTLEFRHGPMSVVQENTLITGLVSDQVAQAEIKVLQEMKQKGASILAFCEQRGSLDWGEIDWVIETQSGLDDWSRPLIYLPLIQWLAFYRSLAKGLDPDHPVNLTQVVSLE